MPSDVELSGLVSEAQVWAALPRGPNGKLREDSWICQYVTHGYMRVASPLMYHLATGLTLLGNSCPADYVVRNGFLAPTKANIWWLIVGESGRSQKSLALATVGMEMAQEVYPDRLGSDPGSEEFLAKSLQERPIQLVGYSEFGRFLAYTTGSAGANYRAKLPDALCDLFDGLPFARGKMKENFRQSQPRLSLLGACTPVHLENHTTAIHWEGGFLSRFGFAYAARERTKFSGTPDGARETWLKKHLEAKLGCTAGNCVGMDPDAKARWESWSAEIEEGSTGLPPQLAGVRSRMTLLAAKCACLFAWDYGPASKGDPWTMTLDYVEPAIRVAMLSWQGAQALAKNIAPSEEARWKRAVYNSVGDAWTPLGTITRDAYMMTRRARSCLEALVGEGVIVFAEQRGVPFYRRVPGGAPPAWEDGYSAEAPLPQAENG